MRNFNVGVMEFGVPDSLSSPERELYLDMGQSCPSTPPHTILGTLSTAIRSPLPESAKPEDVWHQDRRVSSIPQPKYPSLAVRRLDETRF